FVKPGRLHPRPRRACSPIQCARSNFPLRLALRLPDNRVTRFVASNASRQEQVAPASDLSPVTAPAARADEIFLEGPKSRFEETLTLIRVVRDFLRGFRVLHFVGPCVTVFGSARVPQEAPHYE